MRRYSILAVIAFLLYVLVSWPPLLQDFILGALVAATFSVFASPILITDERKLAFDRFIEMLKYCAWYLTIVELKAHLGGLKAALKPSTIRPRVVSFKARSSSDYAIAWLANSITNTPGTVTVDVRDGELVVHCLFGELGTEPIKFDEKAHRIFD